MISTNEETKQKVAIVGSGMAGLATAYLLHNDPRQRYHVTIFESGSSFSLDQSSVSVRNEMNGSLDRVDVPMRAFAAGYYRNLIRMYDYLGVSYRSQRFTYSFERYPDSDQKQAAPSTGYFIHTSSNHRIPPLRPAGLDLLTWILETLFVSLFYLYWSICCFCVTPRPATPTSDCESVEQYVKRIRLPQRFVTLYLLPLMASVATCSHKALLEFPAKDLTDYKRLTTGGDHFTVSAVHKVQERLSAGLHTKISTKITSVERTEKGRSRVSCIAFDGSSHHEFFDHVVLAVAPDVVGSIFSPLRKAMSQIPSTAVQNIVHGDGLEVVNLKPKDAEGSSSGLVKASQILRFRTSAKLGETESIHIHSSGVRVLTCPISDEAPPYKILRKVSFRRAIRTPRSRRILNSIFNVAASNPTEEKSSVTWRNGDDNVWLVGGWCWDGMVLLEGCVISAMRVSTALGVGIPWDTKS